jgi:hypothetical protein
MVWLSPPHQTLAVTQSAIFSLATAPLRASAAGKTLALSLSPLPRDITATLSPTSLAPGEAATLTLSASAEAALGDVAFTVQATSGAFSEAAQGTAVVIASDFSVSLEKDDIFLGAGNSTSLEVTTSPLVGPAETVAFSVGALPVGVSAAFEQDSVTAGGSTTLVLSGSLYLVASQADLRVIATSPSASHRAAMKVRSLSTPQVEITWPIRPENISGTAEILADAAVSDGTTLSRIELLVDGAPMEEASSTHSPAVLKWNTRRVRDGPHELTVRATDVAGTEGRSRGVAVWVDNKGSCGCASEGGGWETLGLIGLLAALRPRKSRALSETRAAAG